MAKTRAWAWVVASALLLWCRVGAAQTFYKWTDDAGTVHFSDAAPPHTQHVEERRLPIPAGKPSDAKPADGTAAANPDGAGATASGSPTPALEGPARIILVSHKSPRLGPSAVHVAGEVKNVGGTDARAVGVTISAIDASQGNPCLQEEAEVNPPTLHPGESGTFDIDVDSPCLLGQPPIDVSPVWD